MARWPAMHCGLAGPIRVSKRCAERPSRTKPLTLGPSLATERRPKIPNRRSQSASSSSAPRRRLASSLLPHRRSSFGCLRRGARVAACCPRSRPGSTPRVSSGDSVERQDPPLIRLLRRQDLSSHGDDHLLLLYNPGVGLLPRDPYPSPGIGIRSNYHHSLQISRQTEFISPGDPLDALQERHVISPDKGGDGRPSGSRESQRVGCHREARRPHMAKAATDDSYAVKVADAELIRPMIVVLPKYKKLRFWNGCHFSELVGACIILFGCYDMLY